MRSALPSQSVTTAAVSTAVEAPMSSATVRITAAANPGAARNVRMPQRTSSATASRRRPSQTSRTLSWTPATPPKA